jgi:hypothetical protein
MEGAVAHRRDDLYADDGEPAYKCALFATPVTGSKLPM